MNDKYSNNIETRFNFKDNYFLQEIQVKLESKL